MWVRLGSTFTMRITVRLTTDTIYQECIQVDDMDLVQSLQWMLRHVQMDRERQGSSDLKACNYLVAQVPPWLCNAKELSEKDASYSKHCPSAHRFLLVC